MAERKSPQTKPVKDNSFGEESNKVRVELSKQGFDSVINLIKRSGIDRAESLMVSTAAQLKVLKKKRTKAKAVKGQRSGSGQGDVGSINTWIKSVDGKNKKALDQLVAIDATCFARINQ